MSGRRPGTAIAIAALALALTLAGCSDETNGPEQPGDASERPSVVTPEPTTAGTDETPPQGEDDGQLPDPEPSDNGEAAEPYATIAAGLRIPWALAFDGDTIYISEREGNIVKQQNGETVRQSVRLSKPVHHEGEGGFLGFALAPEFAETGLAYAYYTYSENGTTWNRIVLLKQEGAEWTEQRALLEQIPGNRYHNGGRLVIGPDLHLYATTGDALETSLSQDPASLAGKILRLTLEGEVPLHNPFGGTYIYSYGHRNPQGLAWSADGDMYSTEHGPSGRPGGHDEINRIEPGGNYGWPDLIGDNRKDGMIASLYHTGEEAIAPSGTITDEQGRLVIATLRGEAIYRYTPETGELEVIHEGDGRIRDLHLKDGKLYFITNNRDGRGNPLDTDDRLIAIDYI